MHLWVGARAEARVSGYSARPCMFPDEYGVNGLTLPVSACIPLLNKQCHWAVRSAGHSVRLPYDITLWQVCMVRQSQRCHL